MNRDPAGMASIAQPRLTEVLKDPTADWAEVRAAIRNHAGRGVATNAGVLAASLAPRGDKESVNDLQQQKEGEDGFALNLEDSLDIAEDGGGNSAGGGGGAKSSTPASDGRYGVGGDSSNTSSQRERVSQSPARQQLLRKSSKSSFRLCGSVRGSLRGSPRSSLKNVLEDQESCGADDADDSEDNNEPFEGDVASQRVVPARYLPRKTSKKGGSFRNSLKEVAEEANANGSSLTVQDDGSAGGAGSCAPPPLRQLPRKNSGKAGFRRASLESMHEFYSDSSLSTACSDRRKFLSRDDSVNVMDFGVSHRRFTDSALLSHGTLLSDSFNSSALESDGFLPWADNDSSSDNAIYCPSSSKRRGQELSDSQSSSLSNLVDSVGFMDWQVERPSTTLMKERAAVVHDISAQHKETECNNEKEPNTENIGIGESRQLHESWRIKDYEQCTDDAMRSGSGSILPHPVKRLTDALKRNSWDVSTNDQKAAPIDTGEIKRVLLQGRTSEETLLTGNNRTRSSGERPRRNSTFQALFGGRRNSCPVKSTQLPSEDEKYSRAIRINREDDVDVYQLRRELCAAGAGSDDDDKNARGRMKFGLFSRAD